MSSLGVSQSGMRGLFTSHLGPSPQPHPFSKQMPLSSQSPVNTTQDYKTRNDMLVMSKH